MRNLLRNLWRYRIYVFWGLVALLFVDAGQLAVPQLIRFAVDGIERGRGDLLPLYALAVLGIAVFVGVFRYFWRYFLLGASRGIRRDIRNRLYEHILKLSARFYQDTRTGDLMAHFTNDVDAVMRATGFGVLALADFLIIASFAIGAMISISPALTLYSFAPLPLLTVLVIAFGRIIHRRFHVVQETFSRLTEKVQEALSGIRVIKTFTQERGMGQDFSNTNRLFVDNNMRLVKVWTFFEPTIDVVSGISRLIVLFAGGRLVLAGAISLGEFIAFAFYLEMLAWPMRALGLTVNMMQRGSASMNRIDRILATPADVKDAPNAVPFDGPGRIEYRRLTFSYDGGPPALREIDLVVESGRTLGVIGLTGAGKSTLVHLLVRVFDPPPGRLLIDGRDVRDYRLAELRRQVTLVPQDGFLYSTTVRDNIAFGKPDATVEEIEWAAKRAGIYAEITGMPRGFETLLGERGVSLSGGQKQRVAIARALVANPKVLILDDALSSVDAEKEEEILHNLREVLRSRTSIVIAHRISAVKDLDQVIVLDRGRIVERGTHEELLAKDGIYAHLHELQRAEEEVRT